MAWGHSVATVVIDTTDQQGIGFATCNRVIVALVVELGLHRVKEITIEDGGLLAGEDLALEGDLADVEAIAQQMGERAAGEWDAADRAPALERSHLGDDPSRAEVWFTEATGPSLWDDVRSALTRRPDYLTANKRTSAYVVSGCHATRCCTDPGDGLCQNAP